MNLIIDILVWWMILDAILSYFHISYHSPFYKMRMIIGKIQLLYVPIRKVIKPRGVDLSPLILILGLQMLGRLFH